MIAFTLELYLCLVHVYNNGCLRKQQKSPDRTAMVHKEANEDDNEVDPFAYLEEDSNKLEEKNNHLLSTRRR